MQQLNRVTFCCRFNCSFQSCIRGIVYYGDSACSDGIFFRTDDIAAVFLIDDRIVSHIRRIHCTRKRAAGDKAGHVFAFDVAFKRAARDCNGNIGNIFILQVFFIQRLDAVERAARDIDGDGQIGGMLRNRDRNARHRGTVAVWPSAELCCCRRYHGISGNIQLTRTNLDAGIDAGYLTAVNNDFTLLRMINTDAALLGSCSYRAIIQLDICVMRRTVTANAVYPTGKFRTVCDKFCRRRNAVTDTANNHSRIITVHRTALNTYSSRLDSCIVVHFRRHKYTI